jgi:ferritin-like metal-binding protein YciE
MSERDLDEQLTKYLADVHAIEEQALTQMRRAPKIAGDTALARIFEQHLEETERQEQRVRQRLESRAASPSLLKDLAGRAGGVGMIWFARSQPDTPGKLVAHAFSYEHLELAAYELLQRVARRAGDLETVSAATEIGAEESRMAERIASHFDRAVEASLRDLDPDDLGEQLNKYLADAHAIEKQAIGLLERAPDIAGEDRLAQLFSEHLQETRVHERLVTERLEARDAEPSAIKDAALRAGALNWGAFFAAQPDTPAKLAGFAYAFEHLEIGAYELLRRVAERAGDTETVEISQRILAEERAAAEKIAGEWDSALDASLDAVGAGR